MLKPGNVGYAATCNSVGQQLGWLIGFVVFTSLGTPVNRKSNILLMLLKCINFRVRWSGELGAVHRVLGPGVPRHHHRHSCVGQGGQGTGHYTPQGTNILPEILFGFKLT